LVEFVFRHCPESEAGKLSSLKLQSLFDTTADRIEKMKQLHGNDFDKKINLQASLAIQTQFIRYKLYHDHSRAIPSEAIFT